MNSYDLVSYWAEVTSKDLTFNTVFYYTPDGEEPELCIVAILNEDNNYEDGYFRYINKRGVQTTDVWQEVGYNLFVDKKYEVVKHCDSFYEALQTFHFINGSGKEVLMKI